MVFAHVVGKKKEYFQGIHENVWYKLQFRVSGNYNGMLLTTVRLK